MGFDLFLRGDVFDGEFGPLWKRFGQHDESAGGTHSVSGTFDSLRFTREPDANGHAKQNALRAAAFFRG